MRSTRKISKYPVSLVSEKIPYSRWIFCLLYFPWFWTCFFQILDAACFTWHDATFIFTSRNNYFWYFHIVKNSRWKHYIYSMDKTRYTTAENVIKQRKLFSVPFISAQPIPRLKWAILILICPLSVVVVGVVVTFSSFLKKNQPNLAETILEESSFTAI